MFQRFKFLSQPIQKLIALGSVGFVIVVTLVSAATPAQATSPCAGGNTYATWSDLKSAAAGSGTRTICLGSSITPAAGTDYLEVLGDVTLDLNGFTLTISASGGRPAVQVLPPDSLTIQDSGVGGTLNATGGPSGTSAIGGSSTSGTSGAITITSGTINATSVDNGGAAIGGGVFAPNGPITITGGTVTAEATGFGGAGIGSGFGVASGPITITGGSVLATSADTQGNGDTAAAIGNGCGGWIGAGAGVQITGGTVQALVALGGSADGIGSGSYNGTPTPVTITGGTVTATRLQSATVGPGILAAPAASYLPSGTWMVSFGGNHYPLAPLATMTVPVQQANVDFGYGTSTYLVTYMPNGGTGTMTPAGFSAGGSTTIVDSWFTPPTGYSFAGWGLSASSGPNPAYSVGQVYSTAASKVLYAQWTLASYNVAYDPNTGSGSMNSTQFTFGSTATISPSSFTPPTGSTFAGWGLSPSSGPNATYAPGQPYSTASDLVLYAQWSGLHYSLGFQGNGGAGALPNMTYTAGGNALTVPANPYIAPSGQSFASWNTAADGSGTSYSPGATVTLTQNLVLYAQWTVSANQGQSAGANTFRTQAMLATTGIEATTGVSLGVLCMILGIGVIRARRARRP